MRGEAGAQRSAQEPRISRHPLVPLATELPAAGPAPLPSPAPPQLQPAPRWPRATTRLPPRTADGATSAPRPCDHRETCGRRSTNWSQNTRPARPDTASPSGAAGPPRWLGRSPRPAATRGTSCQLPSPKPPAARPRTLGRLPAGRSPPVDVPRDHVSLSPRPPPLCKRHQPRLPGARHSLEGVHGSRPRAPQAVPERGTASVLREGPRPRGGLASWLPSEMGLPRVPSPRKPRADEAGTEPGAVATRTPKSAQARAGAGGPVRGGCRGQGGVSGGGRVLLFQQTVVHARKTGFL